MSTSLLIWGKEGNRNVPFFRLCWLLLLAEPPPLPAASFGDRVRAQEPCGRGKEKETATDHSQDLRSERRNVVVERLSAGWDDSCWRTYSCWSGTWHRAMRLRSLPRHRGGEERSPRPASLSDPVLEVKGRPPLPARIGPQPGSAQPQHRSQGRARGWSLEDAPGMKEASLPLPCQWGN